MRIIIRHIILLAAPVFLSAVLFAQDIHFSQFFEAPLLRNPSLAGLYTGDVRVQGVYRDQWNSVTNAYKTGSLNAEVKKHIGRSDDFMTLGLQMLYDRAGTVAWTSTHFLPAVNYHKSLSSARNSYLSAGFMGGFVQKRFDLSKATTNSQYNGGGLGETLSSPQYIYLDGSAGISYNTNISNDPQDNLFIGVAYHHFNRPKQSFYRNTNIELHPKWVGSAGIKFGVTDYSYITIQADHSRQGGFVETVGGALYGIKLGADPDNPDYTLHGGALIRLNDALIPVVKLDYSPFSVALSYDVNISKLKSSSLGRGGFEISVSYIGSRKNNSTVEYMMCPRF
jgi:type IX secretion system PorP/SprF family membrane protein